MLFVGEPHKRLEASEVVLVELAHGSVELKQHTLTETILSEKAVEPIVPLRGLIELCFLSSGGVRLDVKSSTPLVEPSTVD